MTVTKIIGDSNKEQLCEMQQEQPFILLTIKYLFFAMPSPTAEFEKKNLPVPSEGL